MATVILDEKFAKQLIDERQAKGLDRFDEVWEGTYMMAPLADNEHQQLAVKISSALLQLLRDDDDFVFAGTNVSDRREDWTNNYRIPDVAVYLKDNPATDMMTHWFGGPDLAIEIVSKGDRARDKLDFYRQVNTNELLILDRSPWSLEYYRLSDENWSPKSISVGEKMIETDLFGLQWSLAEKSNSTRPCICIHHPLSNQTWSI